jgi:hypothetical protein
LKRRSLDSILKKSERDPEESEADSCCAEEMRRAPEYGRSLRRIVVSSCFALLNNFELSLNLVTISFGAVAEKC